MSFVKVRFDTLSHRSSHEAFRTEHGQQFEEEEIPSIHAGYCGGSKFRNNQIGFQKSHNERICFVSCGEP